MKSTQAPVDLTAHKQMSLTACPWEAQETLELLQHIYGKLWPTEQSKGPEMLLTDKRVVSSLIP